MPGVNLGAGAGLPGVRLAGPCGWENYVMIELETAVCRDFEQARQREWLETNGVGSFACSTITGMNTRRYHGLLIAATRPPVGRLLLLSKLEETLLLGDARYDLSTNQYDGAVHPAGFRYLASFRLDPFPIFRFDCEGVVLEKSVFMVYGSNSTVVEYRMISAPPGRPVRLELRPLVAFRDYHATTHENGALDSRVEQQPGMVSIEPYSGLPRMYLAHNAERIATQSCWYRRFLYAVEAERGLDCIEDLFNPLMLTFDLSARPATLVASTEAVKCEAAPALRQAEVERRAEIASSAPVKDPLYRQLALAADQFLVRRGQGYTVIAGYPWFTDWGRDTMIALPGLTLPTGNAAIAKGILLEFARHVDRGMLPNRFPDQGEAPEFNTVDATLWFFEAVRAYCSSTGDAETARQLYPVLKDIVDWHVRGTRYNIRVQEDGLLHAGEVGVQLTWMDAKVGDWVVTPRSGNPVEIQALWFNALKIMEQLAGQLDDREGLARFRSAASLLHSTFNRVFWNDAAGCLYDVVNGGNGDPSLRPNQIFAASLHYSMLSPDRAARVVEVVERRLLTPFGLRTLDRDDANYKPRYQGNQWQRDSAYHQGTVWPWLLGPFITACVKVQGNTQAARDRARELLRPLEAQLSAAALGQVAEIYDGDPPQRPRGCFAQAWSVGELLRVLAADIYQVPAQRPFTPRAQAVSI
jgi:predicted glycogen debranching enzyme